MTTTQVNLGFIGAGGIAQYHAGYLNRIPAARVVAAADVNMENARALAAIVGGGELYQDYHELLARDDVDAVLVCLPTHLHAEAVIAAARAGKHVFCEKPLARHARQADEMIETAEKHGVRLTVGQVRRFDNEWNTMRRIVQDGRLGRPVMWRFCNTGAGPGQPWFCIHEQGGGPLLDGAVHNYDFALHTFGPARRVWASAVRWRPDGRSLDTGNVVVEFQQGDQLLLSWSWGMAAETRSAGMQDVVGPLGGLLWPAPDDLWPDGFDPKRQGAFYIGRADQPQLLTFERNDMFRDQMEHLISTLAEGRAPLVTADDGRRAMQIGLAALESAQTHQAVEIEPG